MKNNYKIAFLSGKGGTGKTMMAVNLTAAAKKATYIDCDVEEPNGHLFFKPQITDKKQITVKIPAADYEKCNGCRKCIEICNFNALAYISDKLMIFDDVCHSCGGCVLLCPNKALKETDKLVGELFTGVYRDITVKTGILKPGQASGIPIIKSMLKDKTENDDPVFIDCPPGSACIVMESIRDADYCVLVAEPTLFGEHNLSLVHELAKLFGKRLGAILNKCTEDENPSEQYCLKNNIPILGKIKFDPELGALNSEGHIASEEKKEYKNLFSNLLGKIYSEAMV